jgi:polar amino acid transport system substrate-binding protein
LWPVQVNCYRSRTPSDCDPRGSSPLGDRQLSFAFRIILLLLLSMPIAFAQEPAPNFWDARERLPKPETSDIARLRFLTTVDFPPFNFLDEAGRLSGFHVDLARAICAELALTDECQIQALPWADLPAALEAGEGEALLAGIAITQQNRNRFAFSRSYLQLPARFVTQRGSTLAEPMYRATAGKRIGVRDGSAHERILRDLFPEVRVVTYSRADWMLGDLREGKTDAVFDDGMRLSFWLAGTDSENCCRFAGGPYLLPGYLGAGMAIALRPEDEQLVDAFDYALREIDAKGVFDELYLRYFPVSFF